MILVSNWKKTIFWVVSLNKSKPLFCKIFYRFLFVHRFLFFIKLLDLFFVGKYRLIFSGFYLFIYLLFFWVSQVAPSPTTSDPYYNPKLSSSYRKVKERPCNYPKTRIIVLLTKKILNQATVENITVLYVVKSKQQSLLINGRICEILLSVPIWKFQL